MPNPTRIEINCETGVESIIELTDAEVAEMEAQAKAFASQKAEEEKQAKAKAIAKTALLDRLGITADEAALLLG
jgi:hypothetical protein